MGGQARFPARRSSLDHLPAFWLRRTRTSELTPSAVAAEPRRKLLGPDQPVCMKEGLLDPVRCTVTGELDRNLRLHLGMSGVARLVLSQMDELGNNDGSAPRPGRETVQSPRARGNLIDADLDVSINLRPGGGVLSGLEVDDPRLALAVLFDPVHLAGEPDLDRIAAARRD